MNSGVGLVSPASNGMFPVAKLLDEEVDFVEKDPSNRYVRYNEILGKGAFKTVYAAAYCSQCDWDSRVYGSRAL
ncbi:hypothetical protein ACFXTH_040943 [Malus domestica]